MTPDALHQVLHHPAVFVLIGMAAAAAPVLGWVLAMGLVGERARTGRAAWSVGLAVFALIPMALVVRLAILVSGSGVGSLLGWLGSPADGWHPHDAIVALWLPVAGVHLVFTELMALIERRRAPRTIVIPLGVPVGLSCLGAAVLGTLAAVISLQQGLTEIVGAEVFAFAPTALVALGLWTQSSDQLPREQEEATVDPESIEHVDIPKRWTSVGALLPKARSFIKEGGARDDADSAGHGIWLAVGGAGGCPGVVDAMITEGIGAGQAWQVGDLPAPTESLVCTAAVVAAQRVHQQQVLVVTANPARAAAALESADNRGGMAWPVGPTVAGLGALRESLAEGRLPAATFLTTAELSAGGIRALTSDAAGQLWASAIGLVILEGFDRGGPLALTHRVHVLRRLRLVLEQRGVQPGLLITSQRSRAVRMLVQQAFPGVSVQDVPLRPRDQRPLTVWLADYHFVLRSPSGWVRQAAEPVATAGHRVRVCDPSGSFDEASIRVWDGDVALTPQFTVEGEASVGLLDASSLLAAWRAIPHRVRTRADIGRHHALWSLIDEPVTRYLLGDDRLARLTASEELPAPAAVAGLGNKLIARSHLHAALHEADQERASLETAFGPALVQAALDGVEHAGFAVRAAKNGVLRSERLGRDPDDPGDPMSAVGQTAAVVDAESGATLRVVDALTAPTRYYPRRVFAHGGRRFTVPASGERERIEVQPVAPQVALTMPRLKIEVQSRGVTEAEQRHTRGRFSYRGAIHSLLVVEMVSGAIGSDGAVVEYEPVTTRYLTTGRVVAFEAGVSGVALSHLSACMGEAMRALLIVGADDLAVVPLPEGWDTGVVVVERSVQGLGVAEVLDERRLGRVFDWVHAMLSACGCDHGCENCTPAWQVAAGELDKHGVIRLLTGS